MGDMTEGKRPGRNIEKRDDRAKPWRARFRGPDGKERSRSFATLAEAKRWKAEQEVAAARGDWIDPKMRRITVGELGERLVDMKTDRNTKARTAAMLKHVNRRWEGTLVAGLDHLEIQAWINAMGAEGKGPETVRGAYRVLREIVTLALMDRRIGHNPCLGVKLPKTESREMFFLLPKQVDELAAAIDKTWPGFGWGLLVRFAAYSGLRAGEIGYLRVRHLDLLRHRVNVAGARKTYGEDGATKTRRTRWVDLPRQLCEELAEHLAGRPHGPEDRVWTGERGGPVNHKWFYTERFRPAVKDLTEEGRLPSVELEDERVHMVRFHDLRHTCVAFLIARGAQQYEVMEHLGHTSIQTTINTYGHLFPSVRDRIRAHLEDTWEEARVDEAAAR